MGSALTTSKFDDAKVEFEDMPSKMPRITLKKNWKSILDILVRHLRDREFTSGSNTTNRVESHDGKIKNVLSSSSKLL